MLPFSKRKANDAEIELDAEDLIPVEGERASAPPSTRGDGQASRPRRATIPPVSYRALDEAVEEDVAGECLKSIAAEVDASGAFRSSSPFRAAPRVWTIPPPSLPPSSASRLPAVTAPPFVRTRAHAEAEHPAGDHEARRRRDSTPSPVFARTSTPLAAPTSSASSLVAPASSVAPVTVGHTPEPTVIVVRERPKAGWVIGAAAIGAVFAVLATRLVAAGSVEEPPGANGANASAPPPAVTSVTTIATAVVAPPPAPPTRKAPSIVKFSDDQGVAIPAIQTPAPSATSASTTAPAKTARPARLGPALPDGSFSLGARTEPARAPASVAPPAAAPPPATPAAPSAAEAPKKKTLTPEQQLAEAQLKASMK